MNVVGVLTYYRRIREGNNNFTSVDKIFLKILDFVLGYVIYIAKERQRLSIINNTYSTFASRIPQIVKCEDLSQMMIQLRLNLVNVFKSEDCAIILWDESEKLFIAMNSGSRLSELQTAQRTDLSKYSNL